MNFFTWQLRYCGLRLTERLPRFVVRCEPNMLIVDAEPATVVTLSTSGRALRYSSKARQTWSVSASTRPLGRVKADRELVRAYPAT